VALRKCNRDSRNHLISIATTCSLLPLRRDGEDLRPFQLHLAETGMSICNRNRIMTGVRFLFRVTLRRLDLAAEIYHLREPQKIPLVVSPVSCAPPLAGAAEMADGILTWNARGNRG
jgi:integrase/recombinase XerD